MNSFTSNSFTSNAVDSNSVSLNSLRSSLTSNSFVRHHRGLIKMGYHCFDRILCNVRIPDFLHMGTVVWFLRNHRQAEVLSPQCFREISTSYHEWLASEVEAAGIPMVDAPKDKNIRRDEWVEPYFKQLGDRCGTAVILKAREQARVVVSYPKSNFHLDTVTRHVNLYYFYLRDPQCGRLFLKLCPYFPFNAQVCLNGHEWLARQLDREGIAFRKQANAILECAAPERLQQLADAFSGDDIIHAVDAALGRWFSYFKPEEQQRFRHQAFLAQAEYCDNLIFDDKATLQRLFDRLLDANRAIGQPDKLAIVFGRQLFRPDTRTGQTEIVNFAQRMPVLRCSFRSTSLKQYVKSDVLLRTENTSYQLRDLKLKKTVTNENLNKVREVLHQSNQRYFDIQQDVLATFVDRGHLQELRQTTVSPSGRRTPGLRLDDPRLLALCQALVCFAYVAGHGTFRTKDLLVDMQRLLDRPDYKLSQLRYDLGKLRGKGLVVQEPNSQRYRVTSSAYRLALLYTKIYHRFLAPLTSATLAPVPADNNLLNHKQTRLDRLYQELDKHLDRLSTLLNLAA